VVELVVEVLADVKGGDGSGCSGGQSVIAFAHAAASEFH
jgi:hypothetical protein